jgi:predicted permease
LDVLIRAAPFFLMIAAGVVIARVRLIDLAGARALSAYVFWVAFPALLIHALSSSPAPDSAFATGLGAYAVAAVVPLIVVLIVGRLLGWKAEARGGAGMASIGGNSAFLGMPMAISLFGPGAAVAAAAVVAIDTTFIMIVATATLLSAKGGAIRRTAALTAGNPLVIASIIGASMMFAGLQAPDPIHNALGMLRATASPVGLVALGVVVGLEFGRPDKGETAPVATAVSFKLLLMPAAVFAALTWVGADPILRAAATLQAACPTAVNVFIQTRTYDVFAKGGAMAVVIATVISVITLPIIGALLAAGL